VQPRRPFVGDKPGESREEMEEERNEMNIDLERHQRIKALIYILKISY